MQDKGKTLSEVATANGIELRRPSAFGPTEAVSQANLAKMLKALNISAPPCDPEAVSKCFVPPELIKQPGWGINLQLYELRSDRNWGIGDFADLWHFCEFAAGLGADFVGLNPLHAGFLSDAERCSPYEPSNRCFLNPLYIAVDEIGGCPDHTQLDSLLIPLREAALVDYKGVADIKLRVLREIWSRQKDQPNFAFESFVVDGGDTLHRHAVFETISQVMSALGQGAGWKTWPSQYQNAISPHVRELEEIRGDDIAFHKWLQWCAHVQLAEAKERAKRAGMRIGLYLDLAVGEALDGSATWSEQQVYVSGAAIGNPPEPFAADGQDWRLAALLPASISEGVNSPFERMLTASMQYAGAIRIDHAAAFARLFLVPTDGVPADGAYVRYPTDSMLRVLAAASNTHLCLVIGEDLGNIADGLKEDLNNADVFSYRILSYEQREDGFVPAEEYPQMALACVSTHDHQTFRGWWNEADIDLRLEHGLVSQDTTETHRATRAAERRHILKAFGLQVENKTVGDADETDLVSEAYGFVGKTPCLLVSVRLADMTDEVSATNIPGTDKVYPNWRPKLSYRLEELPALPLVSKIACVVRVGRPEGHGRVSG